MTGLHFVGLGAMAKGHFQACALSHFWAFLLPAAVVEVAVAICLESLIPTSSPGLFPNTGPYTEKRDSNWNVKRAKQQASSFAVNFFALHEQLSLLDHRNKRR